MGLLWTGARMAGRALSASQKARQQKQAQQAAAPKPPPPPDPAVLAEAAQLRLELRLRMVNGQMHHGYARPRTDMAAVRRTEEAARQRGDRLRKIANEAQAREDRR